MKKVCGPDGGGVIALPAASPVTYGFRRYTAPSRSWVTTGDTAPATPIAGTAVPSRTTAPEPSVSALFADRSTARPKPPGRAARRSPWPPRNSPPVPGRPTFALNLVLAVSLLLFALITWQVVAGGPLVDADRWLLRRFQHAAARHRGLHGIGQFFCDLGNAQIAVPLLAAAIGASAWRGRRAGLSRWWARPLAAALAMAAVPLIVSVTKTLVARPSPATAASAPVPTPASSRPGTRRRRRSPSAPPLFWYSRSYGTPPCESCSPPRSCWWWPPSGCPWCGAGTTGRWTSWAAGACARRCCRGWP